VAQGAPQTARAELSGPLRVHGGAEFVLALHFSNFNMHIFGDLRFLEGHNIANCSNRRA
jgi:hypothetical protein